MSGSILRQWTFQNAHSQPPLSIKNIFTLLEGMMVSRDLTLSRDITSKMGHGSFWMSSWSSHFLTVHAFALRKIKSLSLEEVLAQVSVLLLSRLMLLHNNGNLCQSCLKEETWEIKFAISKVRLTQWEGWIPKLKSLTILIRNGWKFHAILSVTTLIHGQVASYSPQSYSKTSKLPTKKASISWTKEHLYPT